MQPTDDRELVAAAQGGDRASLDALLRRHYDRIFAVCRRVTGNEADGADAAQEALIAIVRGLPRFDGRSSFSTWIYRIATNASLDELRRRRRRPVLDGGRHDRGHDDDMQPVEYADPNATVRIDSLGDRLELDTVLADLAEEFRLP
ncbi:MAG TPA: RNA polymerase sigma factor, partial [Ilumatobacteraceae bacterium]|nr:RNA polymerase sigma factor [Ilumatobacteraceae bacterium]